MSGGYTLDVTLRAFTSAGDQALVGIADLTRFGVADLPGDVKGQDLLIPLNRDCTMPSSALCATSTQEFLGKPGVLDSLKATAAWWHGCQGASDSVTQSFSAMPVDEFGYLFGAIAQKGSRAVLNVDVVHHAATPQPRTEWICGPEQRGDIPAGQHSNRDVGAVTVDVQPTHGGTLGNKQVFIETTAAVNGSLTLGANGRLSFTGTADASECTASCLEDCANNRPGPLPGGPRPIPIAQE